MLCPLPTVRSLVDSYGRCTVRAIFSLRLLVGLHFRFQVKNSQLYLISFRFLSSLCLIVEWSVIRTGSFGFFFFFI